MGRATFLLVLSIYEENLLKTDGPLFVKYETEFVPLMMQFYKRYEGEVGGLARRLKSKGYEV